jgi:hypothetical protein
MPLFAAIASKMETVFEGGLNDQMQSVAIRELVWSALRRRVECVSAMRVRCSCERPSTPNCTRTYPR